jgi:hypothetical protein
MATWAKAKLIQLWEKFLDEEHCFTGRQEG